MASRRRRRPGNAPPERARGSSSHKDRRLCAQVARALGGTLVGEFEDEVLQNLVVESVVPAPDATRLEVVLQIADPAITIDVAREHLAHAHSALRDAVAHAIARRRVPDLTFQLLPARP